MEKDSKNEKEQTENNTTDKNDVEGEEQNEELRKDMDQVLFNKSKRKGDQIKDSYQFWDKQPVPKIKSKNIGEDEIGPVDNHCVVSEEKQTPYNLPTGFKWYDLDIHSNEDLTKV